MTCQYTCYEDLPVMLGATDIARALGISRSKTYELLASESFPFLIVGTRKIVPKDRFIEWINAQIIEKSEARDNG